MMNYDRLMANNPTQYDEMINSLGQKIVFYEHPFKGDEFPVICVNHDLKLAAASTFYDLDDMTAEHKEYEPSFKNGKFYIGDSEEK